MSDYPFILKYKNGKYYQTAVVQVTFKETTRVRRSNALFNVTEHSGWDKSQLSVFIFGTDDLRPKAANGVTIGTHYGRVVPKTAAGLKSVVRRLRTQEAREIGLIDSEIETLQGAILAARERRQAAVAKAWTQGHTVRLVEALPITGEDYHYLRGDS